MMAPPIPTPQRAPILPSQPDPLQFQRLFPSGVLAAADSRDIWMWLNTDGRQIESFPIPPGTVSQPSSVHIAGRFSDSGQLPAVVAHRLLPQQAIIALTDKNTTILRPTDSFIALAGAERKPLIVFSEISYIQNVGTSQLYAADISHLETAQPLAAAGPNLPGFVPLPLAAQITGASDAIVWFSLAAWDTYSADMIFPLSLGLYQLQLGSNQHLQLLGLDRNVQGISPDQTLAASVSASFDGEKALQLHDLVNGQIIPFELHPQSDLGAGFAVFSPSSQHVAWVEAGQPLASSDEISARVRIAKIYRAEMLPDVPLNSAARAAAFNAAAWMQPVGWLDDELLLIQVHSAGWDQSAMLRLDIISGRLTYFSPGRFLKFAYP